MGALIVGLVRTLVAISRCDEFRGEELYIGSLAWGWMEGMPLDPEQLPIIVHLRGSVLFGLLAMPLFALMGPTTAGLKTLAVLWSAMTGGAFAAAFGRAAASSAPSSLKAGNRAGMAALAAALWIAFMPPSFQIVDVLALGSHGDTLLFLSVALLLLAGTRPLDGSRQDQPLSVRAAVALGVFVGGGVLFSFQVVVAVPALLLAWWVRDRRLFLRKSSLGFLIAAGLCAAATPFLSQSATIVKASPMDHFLPGGWPLAWEKLKLTLTRDFSASWLFQMSGGRVAQWCFALGVLLGWLLLFAHLRRGLGRRARALAWFCLIYPQTVLFFFVSSDFQLNLRVIMNGMGSRYLMPILPFVGAGAILACGSARRGMRWSGWSAIGLVCFGGALGVSGLIDLETPARIPVLRGTDFAAFRKHFDYAGGEDLKARVAWSRIVDPEWDLSRALRYQGLHPEANGTSALGEAREFVHALVQVRSYPDRDSREVCMVELGRGLGRRHNWVTIEAVLGAVDPALDRFFLLGVGKGLNARYVGTYVQTSGREWPLFSGLSELQSPCAVHVALGAGFQLGLRFTPYNDNYFGLMQRAGELAPDLAPAFFRGLARGWRTRCVEADFQALLEQPGGIGLSDLEACLDEEQRAWYRSGLLEPLSTPL